MSYHRDYHEFDFDSDMIDMMYGMTDLDKEIARKGGLSNINKLNKAMDNTVRLEAVDNGNPEYIDFRGDIVGNIRRGITFVLTYVVQDDSFYATINDTGESAYERQIDDFLPHEVAEFLIGEEEYNKLKDIHKDYLEANPPKTEVEPPNELQNSFKEVIRLARTGQQPWWSEELKNKSEATIKKLEQYYNEKYDK